MVILQCSLRVLNCLRTDTQILFRPLQAGRRKENSVIGQCNCQDECSNNGDVSTSQFASCNASNISAVLSQFREPESPV